MRKKQRKTNWPTAAEQSGSKETATAILFVDKRSSFSFYDVIKESDVMWLLGWVGSWQKVTSYCIGKWIAYLFGRVSYEVVCRSKKTQKRKDRGVSMMQNISKSSACSNNGIPSDIGRYS